MSDFMDSNDGRRQRAELLQDAIGEIRDEFIEEAHADATVERAVGAGEAFTAAAGQKKPNANRRRRIAIPAAIAACLVVALGVGIFAVGLPSMTGDRLADEKIATETEGGAYTASGMGEEGAGSSDAIAYDSAVSSYSERATGERTIVTEGDEPGDIIETPPANPDPGAPFVLTAAEWNDNANWPFFTNLVNGGTISFPSFGLDPRNRVSATVTDEAGNPLRGETVVLRGEGNVELGRAKTDKNGVAYLFYQDGQIPQALECNGIGMSVDVVTPEGTDDNQQGHAAGGSLDGTTLVVEPASAMPAAPELQVMFIVDTTGSMTDEIAYLQKDFASIAGDVGSDGITYSVNFYRDTEDVYVTKTNGFTGDVAEVQRLINDEYADGGGDTPEAVAQILTETITNNGAWRDDCAKVAFLIFDAPPHDGTDAALQAAVASAAERGIRLVPVVASNADRETELFGRALAIMTNGTYVFLTDDSGVGNSHLEPIVGDYTVELLHDVIVRIINESR